MRRVLFSIIAFLFLLSTLAWAGDGKGCSEAVKKACPAAKTKAGCPAKKDQAASVQMASVDESKESAETGYACPDVGEKAALRDFHESMHPMHMALSEQKYDAVREGLPGLLKASKAVDKYRCEGYDKCPKECRKTFDSRKKELLSAVKDLKKACKGKDDEKVTASFDKMHEAYITFANSCSH
ncbi:MAG: hypothetical protein JSW64_08975 [Candidatus Zixiibacteriota bacterium]|nr:MAG: hypothetical protein JSW64_08975 [candidate division Zixibacteria bacterium]